MREHVWRECTGIVADDGFEVSPGARHKIAFLCFSHGESTKARLEELVDEEIDTLRIPTWAVWKRGDRVARPDRDKAGVPAH